MMATLNGGLHTTLQPPGAQVSVLPLAGCGAGRHSHRCSGSAFPWHAGRRLCHRGAGILWAGHVAGAPVQVLGRARGQAAPGSIESRALHVAHARFSLRMLQVLVYQANVMRSQRSSKGQV